MHVRRTDGFQELPKTDGQTVKQNSPMDRLPDMLKDGKISKSEYQELFGTEEEAQEYNLYDPAQRDAFVKKLNAKYPLPKSIEKKGDTKELKLTRKDLELVKMPAGEKLAINPQAMLSNEVNEILKEVLANTQNIDKQAEEILASLIGTFKKEDGTIDTEGLRQFLSSIAGNGSVANLQEIKAALDKIPQKTETNEPETTPFSTWKDLADGYNLPNKYDMKTKLRMMKILQAIDWNNMPEKFDIKDVLNVDVIADFAKATIEKGVDKALEEFDYNIVPTKAVNTFGDILPIDRIKLLKVINTSGGVDGNVYIPSLYNSDGTTVEYKKPENAQSIVMGGRGTVKVTDEPMPDKPQPEYETQQTETLDKDGNSRTQYYKKSVGEDEWGEISKEEYDYLRHK